MKLEVIAVLALGIVSFEAQRNEVDMNEKDEKLRTEEDVQKFKDWATIYKKTYDENSSKSEAKAMTTFFENLDKVKAHNLKSNESYKLGLNEDADMTYEEIKALRMGIKKPTRKKRSHASEPNQFHLLAKFTAPKSVDYSKHFPPIKNQGSCQSCWAFTAVDVIEYFLRRKKMSWSLSMQNLVDCSNLNYGCSGGWPTHAFTYIRDEGISNGSTYTYKGVKQVCQRTPKKFISVLKIPDACEIFLKGNEVLLMKIIARYGPVSGAMSTTENFTKYKAGNFDDMQCRNHTVDHAVTICGYGSNPTFGDYWIIRNSWGSSWGMNGYGWIARNRGSACGIALYAMFPCESTKSPKA